MAKIKKTAKKQRVGRGGNNPQNLEGHSFRDHPERINKKGRPPLMINDIINNLEAKGYKRATQSQLIAMYSLIINLTEAELKQIQADTTAPWAMRRMINAMGTKEFIQIMDRMVDRAYGRAMQHIETTIVEQPLFGEDDKQIE